MNWHDIGIDLPPWASGNVRLPCPHCSDQHRNNDKTLGVDVERGIYHCFRCEWKGRAGGWSGASVTPIYQARVKKQGPGKQAAIDRVIHESQPLTHETGGPVLRYLLKRLDQLPDPLPKLGCHPDLKYFDSATGKYVSTFPAMIAVIRDPSGKPVSLHRTYLTENGYKAPVGSPKKIMSPAKPGSITAGAVRLYEPEKTLILAEGIETALALHIVLKKPAWACISAHGLATVQIPDTVTRVIIGADNDISRTGQTAAAKLKNRLRRKGRQIRILIPNEPEKDWADIIQE